MRNQDARTTSSLLVALLGGRPAHGHDILFHLSAMSFPTQRSASITVSSLNSSGHNARRVGIHLHGVCQSDAQTGQMDPETNFLTSRSHLMRMYRLSVPHAACTTWDSYLVHRQTQPRCRSPFLQLTPDDSAKLLLQKLPCRYPLLHTNTVTYADTNTLAHGHQTFVNGPMCPEAISHFALHVFRRSHPLLALEPRMGKYCRSPPRRIA